MEQQISNKDLRAEPEIKKQPEFGADGVPEQSTGLSQMNSPDENEKINTQDIGQNLPNSEPQNQKQVDTKMSEIEDYLVLPQVCSVY